METTLAKDYYRKYIASDEIRKPHHVLADTILSFKPRSVFEFGCGSGKNLKLLREKKSTLKVSGIDISATNIVNCYDINKIYDVAIGDENSLKNVADKHYDVVFTCSVLDHIEKIEEILQQFERLSKKAIVLFETNDISKRYPYYYYPHKYEQYGFTKLDYSYTSNEAKDADGCTYGIWTKNLVSQS